MKKGAGQVTVPHLLGFKNRDLILQRAESTYRKALSRKIPLYQKVCCNFEKLERKSKKYDPNYVPSKKKIRATVPSK